MKKSLLLLIALLFSVQILPMKDREHWSVTLYRQYPFFINVLKNQLLVWGGAQLVRGLFPLLDVEVCEEAIKDGATIISVGAIVYYFFKKPGCLVTTIKECPVELLRHNHCIDRIATKIIPATYTLFKRNNPADWIDHPSITVEWMEKNINFFTKLSAFFMLGECDGSSEFCRLGRSWQPEYRALYEKELVKLLSRKIKKTNGTVHYTDFGCGGLFQTLVVLTKTLIANPQAHIAVHCIDLQFKEFARALSVIKKSRRVGHSYEEPSAELMEQLKELARKNMDPEDFKQAELIIKKGLLQYYTLFNQFSTFFKYYFPYAHIYVYVYGSAEDFMMTSKHKPDVVSAVDIQDMCSGFHQAYFNYVMLCMYALGHKYDSQNLFLMRSDSTFLGEAYLTKITNDSIKEFKNYKRREITISSDECTILKEPLTYYTHRKLLKIGWSGKNF